MTAVEVLAAHRCTHHESTGCTGFIGDYDNQTCDRPCRRGYDIATWSYTPSEVDLAAAAEKGGKA